MSNRLFDILGPVMIGPSSSHTAGALRIGRAAGMLCNDIKSVVFYLHGSFSTTYKGHGSDRALVGGLLGMQTDSPDIKNALEICAEKGITVSFVPTDLGDVHPNTVKIDMTDSNGILHSLTGCSIGGGEIKVMEINGFKTEVSGKYPAIVTKHNDRVGVIKNVVSLISDAKINIVTINLSRAQKGKLATAIIETDEIVSARIIDAIKTVEGIEDVLTMDAF